MVKNKVIALVAGAVLLATCAYAAVQINANAVRTNQIVISIQYDEAGVATGATISATGHKLQDNGDVIGSVEMAWEYSNLGAGMKGNVRALVQAASVAMSGEVNESDELDLGQ